MAVRRPGAAAEEGVEGPGEFLRLHPGSGVLDQQLVGREPDADPALRRMGQCVAHQIPDQRCQHLARGTDLQGAVRLEARPGLRQGQTGSLQLGLHQLVHRQPLALQLGARFPRQQQEGLHQLPHAPRRPVDPVQGPVSGGAQVRVGPQDLHCHGDDRERLRSSWLASRVKLRSRSTKASRRSVKSARALASTATFLARITGEALLAQDVRVQGTHVHAPVLPRRGGDRRQHPVGRAIADPGRQIERHQHQRQRLQAEIGGEQLDALAVEHQQQPGPAPPADMEGAETGVGAQLVHAGRPVAEMLRQARCVAVDHIAADVARMGRFSARIPARRSQNQAASCSRACSTSTSSRTKRASQTSRKAVTLISRAWRMKASRKR